ncbi:MAG: XdhC family protein [Alphaproteobacteria bacterium]
MTESANTAQGAPDPLTQAADWVAAGGRVAIATVLETWGSAPRQAGSQLVIHEDGRFEGSVSGGCVEGEVIVAAQDSIESGKPHVLEYGVSNEKAWQVGLACGGRIRILVEPITA